MFSIPLCTRVMMKEGGCFSFSCWHIFILMEHAIPTDIHCIQEWGGGGAGGVPLWLFVCFALLNFPISPLLKEKYRFAFWLKWYILWKCFKIFFQSGPTYHFCMIYTTTLRRTSKYNIRNGPPICSSKIEFR